MKKKRIYSEQMGFRIPESKKVLLAETGIQQVFALESIILWFVIRNTAQGIRNPAIN